MPRPNTRGKSSGRRGSRSDNPGKSFSDRKKSSSRKPDKERGGDSGKSFSSSRYNQKPGARSGPRKSAPDRGDDSEKSGSSSRYNQRFSGSRPGAGKFDKKERRGKDSGKPFPSKRFDEKPARSGARKSGTERGEYSEKSSSSSRYNQRSGSRPTSRKFDKRDEGDDSKKSFPSKRFNEKPARSGPRKSGAARGEHSDKSFSTSRYNQRSTGSRPTSRKFDKKDEGDSGKSFPAKRFNEKPPGRPGAKPWKSRPEDDQGDRKSGFGRSSKSYPQKESGSFDAMPPRSRQKSEYVKKERTEEKAQPQTTAPTQTEKIRLNRFIANSGVCSRREADNLITMGVISVNGKTITELGYKVSPGDEVRYENRVLRAEKPVYILMNKPKGYLTTTDDPQERNTVMQLLAGSVRERIYPVGRLDRNTTGLLLLTNDGDLADKLMHPSYNVKKIYKVELDRPLSKDDFQSILEGVRLEEGKAMVDDLAIISDDGKTVGIELHIGWNRVVRRIFESLNYEVVRLDRSVYAGLDKKDLPRGKWRFLSREEIIHLKHFK